MGAIGLTVVSINGNSVVPTVFGFDIDEIAEPISNDGTYSLVVVRTYSKLNNTSSFIETRYEVQENLATIVAMSDELFLGDVIYYRGRTTEYTVSYQRVFPLEKIKTIFNPDISGTQFNFYENENLLPVFYEITQSILQIIGQLSPSNTFWELNGNTVGSIKTLGTKDNYDLPIIANNSEIARFKTNGNVGIGVPPSYRLDVSTVGAVTTAITRFANITNSFKVFTSNTTPEGNIVGDRGDLCVSNDGSSGQLYIKYSGMGTNTGWISFYNGIGYVPYTGATQDVDLGIYKITADAVAFSLTPTNAAAAGQIVYNGATGALNYLLNNSNVASQIGQTMHAYVHNAEAITINKGQAVYLYQASGNKASVKLAYNTSDAFSSKTFGLAAEDIGAGQNGMVITQGVLDGLNTGMFSAGDTLYLSATPGGYTATKPYAPNHLVYIGIVERANAGNGQIYVRVQNGYELDEIHDVDLISVAPVNNDILTYVTGSPNLWKPRSIATILGYTPLANTAWLDYSGTSTIVGWSSFTNKQIYYRKLDKQIFCNFLLAGTSNSTDATFTLPDNNNATVTAQTLSIQIVNNGALSNTPGRIITALSSNIITINRDRSGTLFTASGTKTVSGQFFYFID